MMGDQKKDQLDDAGKKESLIRKSDLVAFDDLEMSLVLEEILDSGDEEGKGEPEEKPKSRRVSHV